MTTEFVRQHTDRTWALARAWCIVLLFAGPALAGDDVTPAERARGTASQPAPGAERAAMEYMLFLRQMADSVKDRAPEDIDQWWYEVLRECGTRSLAIQCRFGSESLGAIFVEHFGKEGDLVDALLLFGDLTLYPPQVGTLVSDTLIAAEDRPAARKFKRAVFEWETTVARHQVKAFCENPELFERYYRACMWAGLPFGPSAPDREYDDAHPDRPFSAADPHMDFEVAFERLCEHFPRNAGPERPYYWWHARQFQVMAKATMRDDLLRDVQPESLYEAFRRWSEWLRPHVKYLLPHPDKPVWGVSRDGALKRTWATQDYSVPECPFATWKGAVPPPNQDVFQQILAVGYGVPQECAGIMRIPDCGKQKADEAIGREPTPAANERDQQSRGSSRGGPKCRHRPDWPSGE